jgi:hypothetical protein
LLVTSMFCGFNLGMAGGGFLGQADPGVRLAQPCC